MKNKKFELILLLFFSCYSISYSQITADSAKDNKINLLKLSAIGGVTIGGFLYGNAVLSNLWWKGERSKFHFEWNYDWKYSLGADKFGHFYFPYLFTNIYTQAFEWSGIKRSNSIFYAASLAMLYETYVEIKDGFSKQWGFSWGDFSMDFIGAAYPVIQEHCSFLKNINFKISFYPSQRYKNGSHAVIFDDYESTYGWLTINVYNLLPKAVQKYYPRFINLAVGHSVKQLDNFNNAYHELYIGIDWNLEALPAEGSFWNTIKKNLNYYHFPAPAVRISPGVVWYGLKF